MNISLEFKNRQAWQENAKLWQTYEAPIRPSNGDLFIYNLVLQEIKKNNSCPQALLIGDSPELRDLLAQNGFSTTVVANNPLAILAMNELLTYRGSKKEKIVIANWQEMDFVPDSFDIVLSDWGLNCLTHWRDYTMVLASIAKFLKTNGRFVTRLNIFDSTRNKRKVEQIMVDFSKFSQHKFSFLIEMELYSDISTYLIDSFQIDLGKFYREEITAAYHQGRMTFAQWQDFYYPFFDVVMTYPEKQAWESLWSRFFSNLSIKYGNDYLLSDNNPIYIGQKIINHKNYARIEK